MVWLSRWKVIKQISGNFLRGGGQKKCWGEEQSLRSSSFLDHPHFWCHLTVTAKPQLMLDWKWYQASKLEMEFQRINMMYAALPMRAPMTFSCKDGCILTKHTRRWTYSALRYFFNPSLILFSLLPVDCFIPGVPETRPIPVTSCEARVRDCRIKELDIFGLLIIIICFILF